MADRVLRKGEIDSLALYHKKDRPWVRAWTGLLIASHRLLQKRVTELEKNQRPKHPVIHD